MATSSKTRIGLPEVKLIQSQAQVQNDPGLARAQSTGAPLPSVNGPTAQAEVANPSGLAQPANSGMLPKVNGPVAQAVVQNPTGLAGGAPNSPAEVKPMTYQEQYQFWNPHKPLTADQVEAEKKREKSERTIAQIGDAIAAMSNLVATSKGAPNAYTPQSSLSAKNRELWEQLRKEREQRAKEYSLGMQKAKQLDEYEAQRQANLDLQRQQIEATKSYNLAKLEADKAYKTRKQEFEEWKQQQAQANTDRTYQQREKQNAEKNKIEREKIAGQNSRAEKAAEAKVEAADKAAAAKTKTGKTTPSKQHPVTLDLPWIKKDSTKQSKSRVKQNKKSVDIESLKL